MSWSSQPWSGYYQAVGITPPPSGVNLTRIAAEILGPVAYTPPEPHGQVTRAVLEVLGLAAEFAGRRGTVSRIAVEVLGSALRMHKGLDLPTTAVNAVSVAFAFSPDRTGAGQLTIVDLDGYGYSLSWTAETPNSFDVVWSTPSGNVNTTFSSSAERVIHSYVLSMGTGELTLQFLGGIRRATNEKSGVLHEVLVWNRGLSVPERTYVEAYLRCKWIPSSCTGTPLTPEQQDVINEGLIESSNPALNPGWGGFLDELRDNPGFEAFVDCAEAEMPDDPPDPTKPFSVANPDAECDWTPCQSWRPHQNGLPGWTPAPQTYYTLESACIHHVNTWNSDPDNEDWFYSYLGVTLTNPLGSLCNIRGTYLPNGNINDTGVPFIGIEVPPPPAELWLSMEEFLALTPPCIMFDTTAQDIIDSDEYIGDVPPGMEQTPDPPAP